MVLPPCKKYGTYLFKQISGFLREVGRQVEFTLENFVNCFLSVLPSERGLENTLEFRGRGEESCKELHTMKHDFHITAPSQYFSTHTTYKRNFLITCVKGLNAQLYK